MSVATAERTTGRGCKVDGCDGVHNARGWCQKHYQRWLRSGATEWRLLGWGKGWVCCCDPAVYAGGWFRVCDTCGLPIVALMSDHLRERMAVKAPQSVTQTVKVLELVA